MTTLSNLLYNIPFLIGASIMLITLVVILAPWRFFWDCIVLSVAAVIIVCMYFLNRAFQRVAAWMRKPGSWEGDSPDLFI